MAIDRPFWDNDSLNGIAISTSSIDRNIVLDSEGSIILKTKTREISVDDLLDRLEALERAYMEDKILGKTE